MLNKGALERALKKELAALRYGGDPQAVMDGLPAYAGATWELIGVMLCIRLDPAVCEDPDNPVIVRVPTRLVACSCDLHGAGNCAGHHQSTRSRALIPGPIRRGQKRKWAGSAAICEACYPHWWAAHLAKWNVEARTADLVVEPAVAAATLSAGAGRETDLASVLADLAELGIKSAEQV